MGGEKPTHQFEYLGKITQRSGLEWSLDQATSEEVHSFDAVLAVADIASFNADHAHHRVKHRSFQERASWETDGDDGATGANVFSGLLEGLFSNGEKEYCMGAEPAWGDSFDVSDEVFGFGEIDICL